MLGILAGVLFLPPFSSPELQFILTFWLVATGMLFMGRFPNGDPPAWAAGEARPWPTQADARAQREADGESKPGGGLRGSKGGRNGGAPDVDVAPAPTPTGAGSRRTRKGHKQAP